MSKRLPLPSGASPAPGEDMMRNHGRKCHVSVWKLQTASSVLDAAWTLKGGEKLERLGGFSHVEGEPGKR